MRIRSALVLAAGLLSLTACAPAPVAVAVLGAKPASAAPRLQGGTLVVVIPTADGAVIAADSRTTSSDGSYRDDTQKIVTSPAFPVAAFATGTTSAAQPGDRSGGPARVDYDVFAMLRRQVDALQRPPDAADFRRILTACGEEIARSRAAASGQMKGRGVQVGMVAVQDGGATVAIYLGRLEMQDAGKLDVDLLAEAVSTDDSPVRLRLYGDTDYARDQVLQGPGRGLLSRDTVRLLESSLTVRQLKAPAALAAASDIIRTVSRRAAVVPIAHGGVGGPVRAVLLDAAGVHALEGDP